MERARFPALATMGALPAVMLRVMRRCTAPAAAAAIFAATRTIKVLCPRGRAQRARCLRQIDRFLLRAPRRKHSPRHRPGPEAAMMKFLLMVNKQGQTRLAQYFDFKSIEERTALEAEIIRKCLSRTEMQCSFMEHRGLKVVYRRYASLYFIVGFEEGEENELGMLEFIHALVETLDKYFENVCELDIMFNLERAHFIVDEMVMNGCIVDTNKLSVLKPVALLDRIKA